MFRISSVRYKLGPSSNFLTPGPFGRGFGRESSSDNSLFNLITESPATESVKQLLISIHDNSGLPWWATVIFTTAVFRTAFTLPLTIYQHHVIAKIENLKLVEMPEINKKIQIYIAEKARECQWTDRKASLMFKLRVKNEWNALVVRDNCHPFKATLTVLFQLPVWIFLSAALRNAAYSLPLNDPNVEALSSQLAVDGFLWITNLTQPDPFFIMPMIIGLCNLTIIEIQALRSIKAPTRLQRFATNFLRIFTLIAMSISATVPSVMSLYWATSSTLALAQNFLLMSIRFRKFCRIPDTPSTLENPYRQLAFDAKQKIINNRFKFFK